MFPKLKIQVFRDSKKGVQEASFFYLQKVAFWVQLLQANNFIFKIFFMTKTIHILFVCKGNIFRSMTAEYMMKKYLHDNNIHGFHVASAGIEAKPHPIDPFLIQDLKQRNIDVTAHRQTKLTKEILDQQNIVIAMGFNHRDFIKENWWRDVFLFNELAYHRKTPVLDIEETISPEDLNKETREDYEDHVVAHIAKRTPAVFQGIKSQVKNK